MSPQFTRHEFELSAHKIQRNLIPNSAFYPTKSQNLAIHFVANHAPFLFAAIVCLLVVVVGVVVVVVVGLVVVLVVVVGVVVVVVVGVVVLKSVSFLVVRSTGGLTLS